MTSDRKMLALLALGTVLVLAIVVAAATVLTRGDDDADAEPVVVTVTETETVYLDAEPTEDDLGDVDAGPSSYIPGDGVYEVGRDMKAGTYRSTDNFMCYWQITSDANGDKIISNDNIDGPGIVQVRRGQFFTSQGCSDWTRD